MLPEGAWILRNSNRNGHQLKENMLLLSPMPESAFLLYQSEAIRHYADEHVRGGKWSAAEALAESAQVHHGLLPQGLRTKDHYIWHICERDQGAVVGMVWFANIEKGGKRVAYVYDFNIALEWRRKGYGEEAFKLMEDKARSLDLTSIALHVFGHNHAAYALYQKLGYVATNINMSKSLLD
jgi:RimJ/RimL family protein N-acetyltransferase